MIPQNNDELKNIIKECKTMATKRAFLSAAVGATPVPGVDIATDVTILMNILPVINKKFGLSNEQVAAYDDKMQIMILDILKDMGAKLAGQMITKQLVIAILKKMGVRLTTKQIARYVPLIGTAIAGAISFGAMKLVIHQHINECALTVKEIYQIES
jgi:uncharacterized protein (DUF697 family)